LIKRFFATNKIIFGKECRNKIFEGVDILNKCTSITLGPKVFKHFSIIMFLNKFKFTKGRNVVIENELHLPRITKDGVTVAKNVGFVYQYFYLTIYLFSLSYYSKYYRKTNFKR
jgi:chaperonin GroEL (HSP60 family)